MLGLLVLLAIAGCSSDSEVALSDGAVEIDGGESSTDVDVASGASGAATTLGSRLSDGAVAADSTETTPATEFSAGASANDSVDSVDSQIPSAESDGDSSVNQNQSQGLSVDSAPAGPQVAGQYTIAQVIDGTVGAGDGSNPNDEGITGLHDAPLALPGGFAFAQGPNINGIYGNNSDPNRRVEWRCAVFPELGHVPPVDFRINVREGAYYRLVNGQWDKAIDVNLTPGNNGAYLAPAGFGGNPFDAGSQGTIQWRQEADGSFSAPWNRGAHFAHFWNGSRLPPVAGQTAEFLTSEIRIQQPDGRTVDLSQVRVLGQCGIDYWAAGDSGNNKVPGPGIGKYHSLSEEWTPSLYLTTTSEPGSVDDLRNFLAANPIPIVSG